MCITLLAVKQRPNKETLRICFANNNDGAGMAWAHDGKLNLEKGFFTFDHFWSAFKKVPTDNTILVCHFRKVSTGPKDKKNCHPWLIDDNHAFAHNGTFKQYEDKKDDKLSDTGKFVNKILQPMLSVNPNIWQDTWAKNLLETYIGKDNKCIILSNKGEYSILHEGQGLWENGVWFSNDSFKRRGVAAWADSICEKKNGLGAVSPTKIVMELSETTLTQMDTILERIDKKNKNHLIPITRSFNIKKAFNVKLTPYAERLISNKSNFRIAGRPII